MQHKLIAKNAFYQAFARAATSFIGFLITIIIAAKFGATGYGDFTKIVAYVALFYLPIDFGLNAFFLQYENVKFKYLFYIRILIAAAIFVLVNIVVLVLPYNSQVGSGFTDSIKVGVFIFSFSIFAQSIILSASAVFQKQLNYLNYAIGVIFGSLINLIGVLVFAFLNYSIFYILVAFIFSSFVSAFMLLKLTKEKIFPFAFDKRFAKEIFLKSWPIGLMLIFNMVYFRADMIILSILASTRDVGAYGLSYKFFDFLIALPLFLSNAVYPFLLKEKNNRKGFLNLVKKYFFVFLGASITVIIPFWFISPLFILIKPEFASSITPFRILLVSLPFFFTTCFLQWVLIALEKQKYLMLVYLSATIINIALNILLIPRFSYFASATLTVFSEGFVFILLIIKLISLRNKLRKEV